MRNTAKLFAAKVDDVPLADLTKLPVSELHVHADAGVLDRAMVEHLVKENDLDVDVDAIFKGDIVDSGGSFESFLATYDRLTNFMRTEADVTYVIFEYLKKCHQQGAIYVELTCSPNHFKKDREAYTDDYVPVTEGDVGIAATRDSLSYINYRDAVIKGITAAKKAFGIEARALMVLLRHSPINKCEEVLDAVIAHPHECVVGIGLAGDEKQFPPKPFAKLFAKAKAAGLKCTAHAGEFTSADNVMEAWKSLKLDRIGHGIRCVDDEAVMAELKAAQIGLEICPTSNTHRTGGMSKHPFKAIFEYGILCSLNTDDPGWLHTDIQREYLTVQQTFGFSDAQMIQICRNSITMGFCGPKLKLKLSARIDLHEEVMCLEQAVGQHEPDNAPLKQAISQYRQAATATHLSELGVYATDEAVIAVVDRLNDAHALYAAFLNVRHAAPAEQITQREKLLK